MKTHCDTLIVGAGLAGLIAARELMRTGRDVIVIDKGRGVGGRMATRRISGARFDHGAQFITVRDPAFRGMVEEWIEADAATLWSHGFADGRTGDGSLLTDVTQSRRRSHMPARDGHARYRGREGMTSIPKHLATGLDIRLGVQATAVSPEANGWAVNAEGGRHYRAQHVVLTPPVPQSLALLAAGGVAIESQARSQLEAIEYAPCIAYLALLETQITLPEPGALRGPSATIQWVADNRQKGISDRGPALTIHCSEPFSREQYDEPDERVIRSVRAELADVLKRSLGSDGVVTVEEQIRRWRFSRPGEPLSVGAWSDGLPEGLILAGDAFAGARVEGAALSGLAAAALLQQSAEPPRT